MNAHHDYCAMEAKEQKQLSWICIKEQTVPKRLNALYSGISKSGKPNFNIIHESEKPDCSDHRRIVEVSILQNREKEKAGPRAKATLLTAFAQHSCAFAYGYDNGTIKITDTSDIISRDDKPQEIILQAFSEQQPVIALQFSPDAWYLATLVCGNLKLWERQYATTSCLAKKKSAIPTVIWSKGCVIL